MSPRPSTEDELQAFVDDRLDRDRARDVEAYLASHPASSARASTTFGETPRSYGPCSPGPPCCRRTRASTRSRSGAICASAPSGARARRLARCRARDRRARRLDGALREPPRSASSDGRRGRGVPHLRHGSHAAGGDGGGGRGRPSGLALRPAGAPGGAARSGAVWVRPPRRPTAPHVQRPCGPAHVRGPRRSARELLYPPEPRASGELTGTRRDGGLATKYWFRNGYGFAVVGRAEQTRASRRSRRPRAFRCDAAARPQGGHRDRSPP